MCGRDDDFSSVCAAEEDNWRKLLHDDGIMVEEEAVAVTAAAALFTFTAAIVARRHNIEDNIAWLLFYLFSGFIMKESSPREGCQQGVDQNFLGVWDVYLLLVVILLLSRN